MHLCCFEAFLGKLTENFSFYSKSDYLRKNLKNTQKDDFPQQVCKWANPVENLDLFKQKNLIKPVNGDKY